MKNHFSLPVLLLFLFLPSFAVPALAVVHTPGQRETAKELRQEKRLQKMELRLEKALEKLGAKDDFDLEKMADSAFWFALAGLIGLGVSSVASVLGITIIGGLISLGALIATIIGFIKGSHLMKNYKPALSEKAHFRAQFAKISGWVVFGLYALSLLLTFAILAIFLLVWL